MAAPIKSKQNADNELADIPFKVSSTDKDNDSLKSFMSWCKLCEISLSKKVRISKNGSCAQYGMVATENIKEGECLFEIPRSILLHEKSSAIANLLDKDAKDLVSDSGWVPLLISLMYEYNNPESMWRQYLDLVPDFKELNLPLFWNSEERSKLLKGTGVVKAVEKDEELITHEFNKLVIPFIQKHSDTFLPICQDIKFYKKMVAFVMAYSFTEENVNDETGKVTPMMVPVADILNSIAKNNAQLEFDTDVLKMVAVKDISKDEEVFNSYGEPDNSHLLQMYGYTEQYPNNHNDTVNIPFRCFFDVAQNFTPDKEDLFQMIWEYLESIDIVDEDGSIVVGIDGILSDFECEKVLKVLFMSESEFKEFADDEDEDSDDDVDKNIFNFDSISTLCADWKQLLHRVCKESLKRYSTSLEEDEEKLSTGLTSLPSHHKYSLYTTHAQKLLLTKLMDSCE